MDDVLSNFLVKITYDQDQKSRKDFDEGLKQVQAHAAEFGEKIGALPAIVSDATKRISSSLADLYYASQKTGASAEQIDALRRAATQSGEGADNAQQSWNSFSETLRYFGAAAGRQLKAIFGIDYNPNDKFGAFLQAREKAVKQYNDATDEAGKGRAIANAKAVGIEEEALVKGRQDIFTKYFAKQLARNAGLEGEKAAALTRAYNSLADALETVARKADAALFDKFGAVLDRLTKWLDEDSERIVKFFTELATQIGLVFTDLSKLKPAFVLLWEALKEVGGWLQKIIGQPDGSGLAGVRHLLEFISGVVMTRFALSMAAGFIAAFAPLTALILALGALGIIGSFFVGSAQASTGGAAGDLGGDTGGGTGAGTVGGGTTGSGRGMGTGRGSGVGGGSSTGARAGGGTGSQGGGGTPPEGSLKERGLRLMNDLITKHNYTPESAAMAAGQAEAESGINPSGPAGDAGASVGMFQDQGSRRTALRAYQAAHPEMSAWDSTVNFYAQEKQQLPWQHETSMARAGQMGHATEGYGDNTEAKRTRMSNEWLRTYKESKSKTAASPLIPTIPPDFHKRVDEIRAAKPLTPWQQSSNEIHDNRSVANDVNIHVAGGFPVAKTERPLERPRNADFIRNTSSYAA